ncbi:MAG: hypothetical protein RLZZ344_446 [Pseudomonadota bacterium]|jgi:hypothetical protein
MITLWLVRILLGGLSLLSAALATFFTVLALESTFFPADTTPRGQLSEATLQEIRQETQAQVLQWSPAGHSGTIAEEKNRFGACVSELLGQIASQNKQNPINISFLGRVGLEDLFGLTFQDSQAATAFTEFFCEKRENPLDLAKIYAVGLDHYATYAMSLFSQEAMAQRVVTKNLNPEGPVSRYFSEAVPGEFIQDLLTNRVLTLFTASILALISLVFLVSLRIHSIARRIAIMDKTIRFGRLSTVPTWLSARAEGPVRRAQEHQRSLAEQGLRVVSAEVKEDTSGPSIVLTLENTSDRLLKAKALFTFFDNKKRQVGDQESPEFSVGPKDIYTLVTPVPANDGSWTNWRSEIVNS